jgi:hypothetical protein
MTKPSFARRLSATFRAAACAGLLAAVGCGSSGASPDDGGGGKGGGAGTSGATAGTSGGTAGTTGTAMQNCGDPNQPIDPTAMIDDMENPNPATSMSPNRGGSWWAGGDDASKTNGAVIDPDGSVTAEAIPGGRCGSMYAARVTGRGFGVWAVMNVSFGWGPVDGGADAILPYDAQGRTGITFWARVGDTSSNQVRLNVTDKWSNDAGGICDKTVASGPTACYDHFGVQLTQLDVGWHQYRVPFAFLSQQGFGLPRPTVDTTALYTIDFNLPTGQVFDLWVDDISFY